MSNDFDSEQELVSKSQRKREADAMQALGQRLTELKPSQIKLLPISDTLETAISEYNRLPKSYSARNRQLQFIGKLMRESDVEEISAELNKLESATYVSIKTKQKNELEKNARKLLEQGDEEINRMLEECAELDRQQLRQLHREYQRANETKKAALLARCIELLRIAI